MQFEHIQQREYILCATHTTEYLLSSYILCICMITESALCTKIIYSYRERELFTAQRAGWLYQKAGFLLYHNILLLAYLSIYIYNYNKSSKI